MSDRTIGSIFHLWFQTRAAISTMPDLSPLEAPLASGGPGLCPEPRSISEKDERRSWARLISPKRMISSAASAAPAGTASKPSPSSGAPSNTQGEQAGFPGGGERLGAKVAIAIARVMDHPGCTKKPNPSPLGSATNARRLCGSGEGDAGLVHALARRGERAVEVDRAGEALDDGHLEAKQGSVDGRVVHAEIRREADEGKLVDPAGVQVSLEPRRRLVIVLEEGGVAVDLAAEALTDDKISRVRVEPRVKRGTLGADNAMVGPEDLRTVGHFDHRQGLGTGVLAGERGMARGMPVLCEDPNLVFLDERIDRS